MAIDLVSGVPPHQAQPLQQLTRKFTGEILYQVDNSSGRWLSRSEFEALISTVPRTSQPSPGPPDFRLFPPDDPAHPGPQDFRLFPPDDPAHYEHAPRNAGEQGRYGPARTARTYLDGQGRPINPATSATRRTSTATSGGQHVSYQPRLTPLAQAFAQLEIGDFNGLGQFVLKNRGILAQPEIDNLLSEAAYARRAGKNALTQKYVHHAVLLQKCSKCRPEALEPLFQKLATKGETTKDLFADVNKALNSIKSQYAAPEPQRAERVTQGKASAVPEQGRAGNPEPRIIQTREQREVIPHPSMDQARSKDSQRVYVDSHGREVRPAGGRHEPQRSRLDSQIALPTGEMSEMTLNDSGGYRGYETSVQTEGKDPTSANPRPEQAIDSPMGPPGVENQRRQRYNIEGTTGDKETLDAGELVPLC
jgi:hypothetical protein